MSNVQLALQEGQRILGEHYNHEPYGWRTGGLSLRKVAKLYDVSLSTLYRCVATTSMWKECGSPELTHLGMSHLRELLSLEPEAQRTLLLQAEAERWTVSQTAAQRKLHVRRADVRPGRTAQTGAVLVASLMSALTQTQHRMQMLQKAVPLGHDEREALLHSIRTIRNDLDQFEHQLSIPA